MVSRRSVFVALHQNLLTNEKTAKAQAQVFNLVGEQETAFAFVRHGLFDAEWRGDVGRDCQVIEQLRCVWEGVFGRHSVLLVSWLGESFLAYQKSDTCLVV